MLDLLKFFGSTEEVGLLPFLTFLIVLLAATRKTYDFCVWVLGLLNIYHKREDEKENVKESIEKINSTLIKIDERVEGLELKIKNDDYEQRIHQLEKADIRREKQLKTISENLETISSKLDETRESSREVDVAQLRSTLYRLWIEAKKNGYITHASLETFTDLSRLYLNRGGNSVFKSSILPAFVNMEIRDIDPTTFDETTQQVQELKEQLHNLQHKESK